MGSFYNWLSPVPEEVKAKGRYLNLQEGKLETTDKMYKHHMQVHLSREPLYMDYSASILPNF